MLGGCRVGSMTPLGWPVSPTAGSAASWAVADPQRLFLAPVRPLRERTPGGGRFRVFVPYERAEMGGSTITCAGDGVELFGELFTII